MTFRGNNPPTTDSPRRGRGQGSVRQRKDGRWEARRSLGLRESSRRVSAYGATRDEALRALAEKCELRLPEQEWARLRESWEMQEALARAHQRIADLEAALEVEQRKQRKAIPAGVRRAVIDRDGSACRYCSTAVEGQGIVLDHYIPHDRGGGDGYDNLVVACHPCNIRKGGSWPHELAGKGMALLGGHPTTPPTVTPDVTP